MAALRSYDATGLADPEFLESIRSISVPLIVSEGDARTLDLLLQQN